MAIAKGAGDRTPSSRLSTVLKPSILLPESVQAYDFNIPIF